MLSLNTDRFTRSICMYVHVCTTQSIISQCLMGEMKVDENTYVEWVPSSGEKDKTIKEPIKTCGPKDH